MGNFPAVAVAWKLTKKAFERYLYLKIRGGWGITGQGYWNYISIDSLFSIKWYGAIPTGKYLLYHLQTATITVI
jgi:hypothetical protein